MREPSEALSYTEEQIDSLETVIRDEHTSLYLSESNREELLQIIFDLRLCRSQLTSALAAQKAAEKERDEALERIEIVHDEAYDEGRKKGEAEGYLHGRQDGGG